MIGTENTVMSPELAQFLNIFLAPSRQRIQAVEEQKDLFEVRSGIFSDLKSKLRDLRRIADELSGSGGLSVLREKKSSLSDDGFLGATVTSAATARSHNVHVEQLARAHTVVSNRYTTDGLELGSGLAGTRDFQITIDGEVHDIAYVATDGLTNEELLKEVAAAINDAGIPVRASTIRDTDSTLKLSITSKETGTANSMTFTDPNGMLTALGVNASTASTDTAGGYVYADLGNNELDAKLTVDGISILRSSNALSDVIEGVTLELKGEQQPTDADVSLTIETDGEAIREKVQEFLDAYNDVNDFLQEKLRVDRESLERGALSGDFAYINLQGVLRLDMGQTVTSLEGGETFALSHVGITGDASGSYRITDSDKLDEILATDIETFESLFNAADGIATEMDNRIAPFVSGESDTVGASKDAAESRIKLLKDRIGRMEAREEVERERLIQQFGSLQQLQIEQQSMMSLLNNFNLLL